MIKKIHNYGLEGFIVLFGQILTAFGGLYLIKILTNVMNIESYGIFVLGLSIASIINQVVMGGISNAAGRFFTIANSQNNIKYYLLSLFVLILITTGLIFICGVFLESYFYYKEKKIWLEIMPVILGYSILYGINSICSAGLSSARHRKIVAISNSSESWLRVVFIIIVGTFFSVDVLTVFSIFLLTLSLVISFQIFFISTRYKFEKKLRERIKINEWFCRIWEFSWPFSLFGIFTVIQQISDRWSLEYYYGLTVVGQYGLLYQIGYTPIILFSGVVTAFIAPILFEKSGDASNSDKLKAAKKLNIFVLLIMGIICVVIFLIAFFFHIEIVGFLSTKNYIDYSYLLPWIILSAQFFSIGQVATIKLSSELVIKKLILPKIITAIIGTFLNIMGAKYFGISGVVVAQLIFSFIFLIWSLNLFRKNYEKNINKLIS